MVINKYNVIKLVISLFLITTESITLKSQPIYVLDSVVAQLCDVQWQETSYHIEKNDKTNVDSTLEEYSRDTMYNMLMFSDTSRVSDELWHIFNYPFHFKDSTKKTMYVPTYGPIRGNVMYHNGKIIVYYYEYEGNVTDEILFFDEKKLIIRHKGVERTECIEYKRYK